MGWKSSMNVRREDAIRLILRRTKIVSDETLADMLECLGDDKSSSASHGLTGSNFMITPEAHPWDFCWPDEDE